MSTTPTPDYGEPWNYNYDFDLALTRNGSAGDERRIAECVNACAGMADPAAEIANLKMELDASCNAEHLRQVRDENTAMREAIRKAHDAIKASPYPDQQALAKLQPFITP